MSANIVGDRADPQVTGRADIVEGRLRYRSFPHGLEAINGPITFDANGISAGRFDADGALSEPLRGVMGGGDVTIGGTIGLKGLLPDQFDLSAIGHNVRLRYPAGFASTVEANLTLTGPMASPMLGGTVTVLRSAYQQEIDSDIALLGLAAGGGAACRRRICRQTPASRRSRCGSMSGSTRRARWPSTRATPRCSAPRV